jgi:hypothetical protein
VQSARKKKQNFIEKLDKIFNRGQTLNIHFFLLFDGVEQKITAKDKDELVVIK